MSRLIPGALLASLNGQQAYGGFFNNISNDNIAIIKNVLSESLNKQVGLKCSSMVHSQ